MKNITAIREFEDNQIEAVSIDTENWTKPNTEWNKILDEVTSSL